MRILSLILFILGAAALALAAALVIITRRRTRKTLDTMNAMLDSAMNGDFSESLFDESVSSAVETRLAHYLSSCAVTSRSLTEERDKIKELIADISHQTKTPIANILLYAQLLREQALSQQAANCVSALNTQAEKLSFLIGSLVKVSRLEAGVFTLVPHIRPVQPIIDSILAQAAPKAAAKNISLRAEPSDDTACFDEKWTAEALYNIADNAIKYTPEGGLIMITVTAYELFICITVADNGIGIPEAEQAEIFHRFYRSRTVSATEGVGIGLYLARQILTGEGGYIKVRSKQGHGSSFSLFLPRGSQNVSKP